MQKLGHLTLDQIHIEMQVQGLVFYREYFMWGKTPAYRNTTGTLYRFIDRGDVLTPYEMYNRLESEWRPVARDEWRYAVSNMKYELMALQALESTGPIHAYSDHRMEIS